MLVILSSARKVAKNANMKTAQVTKLSEKSTSGQRWFFRPLEWMLLFQQSSNSSLKMTFMVKVPNKFLTQTEIAPPLALLT